MKRLISQDSLSGGGLIPICPPGEEKSMYGRGFPSILEGMEEDECGEEELCSAGQVTMGEKKRRLSVEQVKALEKNFEVENKLEPERKVKLAQELGLQPRQVAVWFQNRRARWKTKQLERDYGLLKTNYDSLKLNYDSLHHEKEALLAEIKDLRSKLVEENYCSIKEEPVVSDSENKVSEEPPALIYKDGSSDSDSSAVLNDENSPHGGVSSTSGILSQHLGFNSSSPFQYSDSRTQKGYYHPQFLRMEEHNFLSSEEPCSSFFSDEQAPTLSWYSADPWN